MITLWVQFLEQAKHCVLEWSTSFHIASVQSADKSDWSCKRTVSQKGSLFINSYKNVEETYQVQFSRSLYPTHNYIEMVIDLFNSKGMPDLHSSITILILSLCVREECQAYTDNPVSDLTAYPVCWLFSYWHSTMKQTALLSIKILIITDVLRNRWKCQEKELIKCPAQKQTALHTLR